MSQDVIVTKIGRRASGVGRRAPDVGRRTSGVRRQIHRV